MITIFLFVIMFFNFSSAFNFDTNEVKIIYPIEDDYLKTISIDREHYEIHEGEHFFVKTWIENTGAVNTNNTFAFTTPVNTKEIHAKALLSPDSDVVISIFENATITGGVNVPPQANNRISSEAPHLQPVAEPTVTNYGNLMWAARNGGGKNPVGVAPGLNYEIIARQNTTYVFTIQKKTTADTIVDIDFFWYEEDVH